MPDPDKPPDKPKIVLDYQQPDCDARLLLKPMRPPPRAITVFAALAGVYLLWQAPMRGYFTRDVWWWEWTTPVIFVWIFCSVWWAVHWIIWLYRRHVSATLVAPTKRWRFYQLPICIMVFALLMFVNAKLWVPFIISRPWMNSVAQKTIKSHIIQPDQRIGLYYAVEISPLGSNMGFLLPGTHDVFFYSADGSPPGLFQDTKRLDDHWYYCTWPAWD